MSKHWRQGDILIERVGGIPNHGGKMSLQKTQHGEGYVLALGESSGHKHVAVMEEGASAIAQEWFDGTIVIDARGNLSIKHDEHDTIELESGIYKITRQREYAPEGERRVLD